MAATGTIQDVLSVLEGLNAVICAQHDELVSLREEVEALREHVAVGVESVVPGQTKATLEQLASRYNVSIEYARSRQLDWGQEPMSDASNSKARYDIATADAWWESRRRHRAVIRRGGGSGGRSPKTQVAPERTRLGALMADIR